MARFVPGHNPSPFDDGDSHRHDRHSYATLVVDDASLSLPTNHEVPDSNEPYDYGNQQNSRHPLMTWGGLADTPRSVLRFSGAPGLSLPGSGFISGSIDYPSEQGQWCSAPPPPSSWTPDILTGDMSLVSPHVTNSERSISSYGMDFMPPPALRRSLFDDPMSPDEPGSQSGNPRFGHATNRFSDTDPLPSTTTPKTPTTAPKRYFCTFPSCDIGSFKGKAEWKKHELRHYPSMEYICQPNGAVLVSQDGRRCAFCNDVEPDAEHLKSHDAQPCEGKEESTRTWVRKDLFDRHLKGKHHLSSTSKQIETWSRKPLERVLGCGYCVTHFNNAHDRYLHMSKHLDDGLTKADWDNNKVLDGLLRQPYILSEWEGVWRETFGEGNLPSVSWPDSIALQLQERLKDRTESARKLAWAAFIDCSLSPIENTHIPCRDGPTTVSSANQEQPR